jgi:hypothetical protein
MSGTSFNICSLNIAVKIIESALTDVFVVFLSPSDKLQYST